MSHARYPALLTSVFLTLFCSCIAHSATVTDWRHHARRLTGFTEDIRQNSLLALQRTPALKKKVVESLHGPDRYLALDVVSALRMKGVLPDLLAASSSDDDGAIHLAINSILAPENARQIVVAYKETLGKDSSPPPVVVAIIDVLGRLGHRLSDDQVQHSLSSADFEVRSAALYYVRLISLQQKKALYPHAVAIALSDPAYSLRLQALSFVGDAKFSRPQEWTEALKSCRDDGNPQVKALCRRLGG